MAVKVNTAWLQTPTGVLKIIELVLVLTCVLVARFGVCDATFLAIFYEGNLNTIFLSCGTFVGFTIIVIAIILAYLLGADLTHLVSDL